MMTDRPILFSAPMVRALLVGTKTQTRRVLGKTGYCNIFEPGVWLDSYVLDPGNAEWRARHIPFAVGDRLWVKETWACHWATNDQKPREIAPDLWSVRYFADGFIRPAARDDNMALPEQFSRKRVSIFMPRWASRLTLAVTEVRVERLQEISEADAADEGRAPCVRCHDSGWVNSGPDGGWQCTEHLCGHTDVEWYRDLWDTINGDGAWDKNPWVVALTFTVEQRNIDA
ncbi:MAG: hypothetical protein V4530_06270 [Pseudomonadota bacterium]